MDFIQPNEFDYMQGIDAFPAYIYKAKYPFDFKSLQSKIDDYLKKSKEFSTEKNLGDPEAGNAITGVHFNHEFRGAGEYPPPHMWDEFTHFFGFLELSIPFLMNEWFGVDHAFNMNCGESWINVHRKGGWTTAHHHQNATISIAAYLEVPENSGNFLVENPLRPYKCSEPLSQGYLSDKIWGPIEVESGDVLFFPGWLTHKTEKSKTDNPRYVLSTNYQVCPPGPSGKRFTYAGEDY